MPNTKNNELLKPRLPHLVTYLIEELPLFLTGMLHKGIKYQTMVYSTVLEHSSSLAKVVNEVQTLPEFASSREEIYQSSNTVAISGIIGLTYTPLPLENTDEKEMKKIQGKRSVLKRENSTQG